MAIKNQIQFRRGSSNDWIAISGGNGPTLNAGEPGFDVTNNILKIGDGSTNWLNLKPIHNINTVGATNNQYLIYNSTTGLWTPTSSGIFSSLNIESTSNINLGTSADINIDFGLANILQIGTENIPRITILGDGNVGIGATNPTVPLEVTGEILAQEINIESAVSGATLFNIEGTNGNLFSVVDSVSGSLMSVNDITGLSAFEVFSDHRVVAGRFNANDFVISSDGNVGVGLSNPSTKLEVSGVITATGGNSTDWNTAYGWGNHAGLYATASHNQAESTIIFTDITTGNSSTSAHGYLPKLGGGTTNYLRADGSWATPPGTTYAKASTTTLGLAKIEDATTQTVAANTVSATASRTYGIQFNSDDQLVVNVPWTDTNTYLSSASFNTSNGILTLTRNDAATVTVDLDGKYAESVHTHDDRYYTETEVDTLLSAKLNTSLKGANSGLAELDATGKVPSSQLPSYVDDVLEYAALANFPATGETGKIYVATGTNLTYRWSGSAYVEISASLALGETDSTAYRGDRGKIAYDHSQVTTGTVHGSSTVGTALLRIANNSTSIKFIRVNADNTLAYRTSAEVLSDIGAYAATNPNGYTNNTGTVTSVSGTGTVAGLTLTGSVTTTGSLTLGGALSTPVSTINDSTTVGQNLVKLTNPSAIRFLRINANNTVDALTDSAFRTAIGAGTSSTNGTVTSVGLSLPNIFNVSNSPISSAGTLSAGFVTQASNTVFAGPSSGNGTPSFRALVAADIPTLNQNTTGSAASLTTARTLTIGSTGKTFNGSADVSWSLSEINAFKVDESIVNIASPNSSSGTWIAGDTDDWGTPRIGSIAARYNDAPGFLQYNIPAGMDTCYISQLQWSTGGYVDVHGVQSDGGLVFLRRINTRQVVENVNEGAGIGNTNQHDGSTITLAATGLSSFVAIRFTNVLGRFHFTGMSFTSTRLVGAEGTGMVHPAQINYIGSSTQYIRGDGVLTTFPTIPTVNNATLTLNVSGTGLSGSQTFTANQSSNATFTVTSNATSDSTASTIVARDASRNFSANTITAALNGNASTATTLQSSRTITIGSTGRSFNGSANISWTLADIGAQAAGNYVTQNTGYIWTAVGGNALSFQSNDILETTTSDQASLEVYQDTVGADAFMQFHVNGDYAVYFGLKGDINDIAVGGWSMGNAYYRVWHAGNDGTNSGLDADLLDGNHASAFQLASTALTTNTSFGGDVSGTYNNIVVADDSHNHIIGNVDGLQSALDLKANTNQTMHIGTTAVAINRASANLSLTGVSIDGNAGTATAATTLTSIGNLTTQNGNGTVGYVYALTNGTAGLFPAGNNANSVLTLNRHPGNYYSQLGFSSNGNLYYRAFNNVAIDTTTPWQTIWTSSSLTNLNQLTNGPGYTTNTGTVTSVATNNGLTGGTITTTGTIGLTGQALALHNLATNGIIARTGSGTVAGRTISASTGISVTNGDGVSGNPTITNTDLGSSQNIFKNIAVAGQSTVVADNNNDTLTFIAGSNITITTDATNDTITINSTASGGGGGTVTGTGAANHIAYWTSASGIAHDANQLVWDATNNRLGIGTSAPSGHLHVVGDTYAQGSIYVSNTSPVGALTYNRIYSGTSDNFIMQGGGNTLTLSGQGGSIDMRAYSTSVTIGNSFNAGTINQFIRFMPANSEAMRITNIGDVGIGTTTPSNKLNVNTSTDSSNGLQIVNNSAGTSARSLLSLSNGSYGAEISLGGTGTPNNGFYRPNRLLISGPFITDYVTGQHYFHIGGGGTQQAVSGSTQVGSWDINALTVSNELRSIGGIAGGIFVGSSLTLKSTTAAGTTDHIKLVVGNNGATEAVRVINNGNVGIGTTTPSYKLQVNGSFGATTKSFRIDHPSRPNYTLEYGSLESPYHGVRLTGRGKVVKGSGTVLLPSYLKDLIHDDENINIQITNYNHGKLIYVSKIDLNNDQFTVRVDRAKSLGDLEFFWVFTGVRKDVDNLVVEQEK